jgi:peptidoglycan/xylan/chitin deacetylase (PgdA/CDA1 family)
MLIFNLHHVEDRIRHPSRKHITISPKGFRRFIRTLRLVGFEIVSLRDVLAEPSLLRSRKRLAILTFDDGYVNNYEIAAPILEEERCPATIFALPGRFGGTNEWDQGDFPEEQRDPLMTLGQMQALAKSPFITFGSHGMLHRNFARLEADDLQYELNESYRILSERLGNAFLPVLAYPWGTYSNAVLQAMEATLYRFAFTVETAPWTAETPHFEVPRYSVFFRDGNPVVLLAKLCRHKALF